MLRGMAYGAIFAALVAFNVAMAFRVYHKVDRIEIICRPDLPVGQP